ncbi:MAG: S46 family peptidase [Chitinophagaceae bacterium]|nr:S46 family peptidase [Chitinophagaceae bacterium]
MKRFLLTILLPIVLIGKIAADEGMWLPLLLGQQVYNDMVKKGLKLTKDQLYSINKPSLKDAIIIFGGGCTGEVVSAEGLIFTNHHCGYDVIAGASTVDRNYLHDGFYAKNKGEEIPSTLSVQFLLRIDDVTAEVSDSLKGLTGAERWQKQLSVLARINSRMSDTAQKIETRVSSLFKGNQFLAFVYQRFYDVRLVGAPPESVGRFGGDTDNWEWPRHTGDFSIFRVYTSSEGKSAKYSSDNVPLKPKWFLPVSLKGFKEGEYSMIWGYPGGTNRYETSYGVALATEVINPTLVKLREVRLKYMLEEMKKDPAVKLQLATSYASVANYWKFYDGETKQLLKHDVYGQKKKFEEKFIAWSDGKPEYQALFAQWNDAYTNWSKYAKQRVHLMEGLFGSQLMVFMWEYILPLETALVRTGTPKELLRRVMNAATEKRKTFLEKLNKESDINIVAAMTMLFYQDVNKDQHPIGFYGNLKNKYGSLTDESTYRKYAVDIFSKSIIFDDKRWGAFMANPDAGLLQGDPAYAHMSAYYTNNYASKYLPYYQQFNALNMDFGRVYLKGIMEMDAVKAKMMYPDGTFTMRVSYGSVKAYRPRDGVFYDNVTTAKGIVEKYKPGDYDFDLPTRQIELLKKRDFGQYIDKQRNDLVVGFITTHDITGGNSGSPVINGNGELIGLSFDGNYEALGHKISYDKEMSRSINVDIRYVLWCIDKLGGAANIIKELKLVR